MMIAPQLLNSLFVDSHGQIREATADIIHEESIQIPAFGGNSVHWIMGHKAARQLIAEIDNEIFVSIASLWQNHPA